MALGLGGSSGGAEAAGGSPSLTYPASVVATNLVIAQVLGDNATGTVSTPANWTALAEFASTTGTPGSGTGPRKISLFYRVATGSLSGTQQFSTSGYSGASGFMYRITSSLGSDYSLAYATGEDTSGGGTWSAAMSSDPGFTTGDLLIYFLAGPTTASNFITGWGTESINPPSCSTSFTGSTNEWEFSYGNDAAYRSRVATVDSGTSTGAITHTCSAVPATNTNVYGPEIIVRIREGLPDVDAPAEASSLTVVANTISVGLGVSAGIP